VSAAQYAELAFGALAIVLIVVIALLRERS
jgi:hypothetical protein